MWGSPRIRGCSWRCRWPLRTSPRSGRSPAYSKSTAACSSPTHRFTNTQTLHNSPRSSYLLITISIYHSLLLLKPFCYCYSCLMRLFIVIFLGMFRFVLFDRLSHLDMFPYLFGRNSVWETRYKYAYGRYISWQWCSGSSYASI